MAMDVPCVAVRGSTGISLSYGPPRYEDVTPFIKDDSKSCKAMVFSPDGKYFAWISSPNVKIASCSTWKIVAVIEKPKACAIQFSPLGTYLMTWEPFIVSQANPQGNNQLHIWKSENGEQVTSFTQKRQADWEPQWSSDEKLCGLLINNDVILYENADFDKIAQKINCKKVTKYKIAPGSAPYHIVCFVPGKGGQPAYLYMFKYPEIDAAQPIVRKTFFQADRVDFYWNKIGTSVLVMVTMDVDDTGASYYGKQTLHYLNTKGESMPVTLGIEGPIHALEWSPKGDEFCIVFGFMPSKAKLFNLKCDPVFDFGVNHRNNIHYNPHGNIVLLGGFGNLRGNVELWDVHQRKLIAESKAPETTLLHWSPDGEHYMTATTAPRLHMSNGFKIWHYTGTLLYERPWNEQEKLYEVMWQNFPSTSFVEKPITYEAVEGIQPSQPQASKEVYRPPSVRGGTRPVPLKSIPWTKRPGWKKKKKNTETDQTTVESTSKNATTNGAGSHSVPKSKGTSSATSSNPTDDSEKMKKIKQLELKLKQISKLKIKQTFGKHLEINQLDKIKKEDELLKELEQLKL